MEQGVRKYKKAFYKTLYIGLTLTFGFKKLVTLRGDTYLVHSALKIKIRLMLRSASFLFLK